MTITPTLERYLAGKNIEYDAIQHQPTMSSSRTAEACRISGDRLAKAVVLRKRSGFVLAILPAHPPVLSLAATWLWRRFGN
jgi:Ala-tRNA(Pro) deacylase